MRKYGIRIGNIGIEFPSIDDRQKALLTFTKGTDVKISSGGIKFTDGEGNFSVYDRDTGEILTICEICKGTFLSDTCTYREYPYKELWSENYSDKNAYICDACNTKQIKAKELHEAKKLVDGDKDA